jgi:predicted O-methyltransferase YrrM
VEIGSARGRSTCALGLACKQNGSGEVHAIDPHTANAWSEGEGDTYDFLMDRLKCYGLLPWVTVHRQTSSEAASSWSKAIDFLFIDGDHTYAGVKSDFELFQRWVKPEGVIAFHDTLWNHYRGHKHYRPDIGVPAFVEELRKAGHAVVTVGAFPGLSLVSPIPGGWSLAVDDPATTLS